MTEKKAPGRPIDPQRQQAVIVAATELFLDQGYENTSMDAVSSRAGVSKQTVYRYYPTKADLFCAVLKSKIEEFSPSINIFEQAGSAPRDVLRTLGQGFRRLLQSEEGIALHRVIVSEACRSPEMVDVFYKMGPMRMHTMLESYLETQTQKGVLSIKNIHFAADHFFSMLKGECHMQQVLGMDTSDSQQEEHLESVLDLFLGYYQSK